MMDSPNGNSEPVPELPRFLEMWRRGLAAIGRVEMVLAVSALVLVVVLSAAQALLRYTIGTSLWWAQEVAETVILVAYFLGVSHVFKARQYIVIEFLTMHIPVRLQVILYLFAQIGALIFTFTTVVLVMQFLPRALGIQTPVLRLPGYVVLVPIAVGSFLMAVTSAYYFVFGLWVLARGGLSASLEETEERGIVLKPETTADW